jgi:hypothetical protein
MSADPKLVRDLFVSVAELTAAESAAFLGGARLACEDANRAMTWLSKVVAAGFTEAAHMRKDANLDFLGDRVDFRRLLAELDRPPKKK